MLDIPIIFKDGEDSLKSNLAYSPQFAGVLTSLTEQVTGELHNLKLFYKVSLFILNIALLS